MADGKPKARKPSIKECPRFCEGWLEKYSLGRSMFSSKGWHRRYFYLAPEGLSYAHKNPRDLGSSLPSPVVSAAMEDAPTASSPAQQKANLRYNLYGNRRPLTGSWAKTFIPFGRRLTQTDEDRVATVGSTWREAAMVPVYFLKSLDVAQHSVVGGRTRNTICSERASGEERSGLEPEGDHYYYFAVSFEEKRKRYLMLLRTRNAQAYLKFKYFFHLFAHEASQRSLIPVAHPLEVNAPVAKDLNMKRVISGKDVAAIPAAESNGNTNNRSTDTGIDLGRPVLGGSAMQLTNYLDPDPVSGNDSRKLKKYFIAWDDGCYAANFTLASAAFATLRRQLSFSHAECDREVQQLWKQNTQAFALESVVAALDELSPSVAEEDYERENKEALLMENGGGGGGLDATGAQKSDKHGNNNSIAGGAIASINAGAVGSLAHANVAANKNAAAGSNKAFSEASVEAKQQHRHHRSHSRPADTNGTPVAPTTG